MEKKKYFIWALRICLFLGMFVAAIDGEIIACLILWLIIGLTFIYNKKE